MNSTYRQHGFVLVTAMIFLIVLSVLGVTALKGAMFEERMASNDRDRLIARENAELALRDAERDILGLRFDGKWCASDGCTNLRPSGTRPKTAADGNFWNVDSATNPEASFIDGGLSQTANYRGVYSFDASTNCGKPVWQGADWGDPAATVRKCNGTINAAVPTVAYGQFTQAPFIGPDGNAPNNIPAPRYIIEIFPGQALISSSSTKVFFRITSVGYGRTTGPTGRTSVTLQSVFSPD